MMDLHTFERIVETIPLPTLPGDAGRGFYGRLRDESLGRRHWRLLSGLWRVHADGTVDLIPPGFAYDKRSGNFLTFRVYPPSVGRQDKAFALHDFSRRTHRIIGKSVRRIDLIEFYDALVDLDKPRYSAWTQSRFVYAASRLGIGSSGMGWHGTPGHPDQYDTPVFDHEDGLWKPLAVWAHDHYAGDGTGYRCMRSAA